MQKAVDQAIVQDFANTMRDKLNAVLDTLNEAKTKYSLIYDFKVGQDSTGTFQILSLSMTQSFLNPPT